MDILNISTISKSQIPENPIKKRYETASPQLMIILEFLGSSVLLICLLTISVIIRDCLKKNHQRDIRSV